MHLQNILTMTVLALSHGVRAQSPTFQAFDGDYCDGDGGNVDAFDGNTRCILTAERHSYYIGGDLPNGATVILFENLDCDGSSGKCSQKLVNRLTPLDLLVGVV